MLTHAATPHDSMSFGSHGLKSTCVSPVVSPQPSRWCTSVSELMDDMVTNSQHVLVSQPVMAHAFMHMLSHACTPVISLDSSVTTTGGRARLAVLLYWTWRRAASCDGAEMRSAASPRIS